jgi:Xaa-Pro aminopeptidase
VKDSTSTQHIGGTAVSTEIELGVYSLTTSTQDSGDLNGSSRFDRVMKTAEDRPSASQDSLPALVDPAADHRSDSVSRRRADIEEKHSRIIRFLDENDYEAVVLGRADSLAWFTAGAELGQQMTGDAGCVQLFINHTSRAVLCDNVQSARVFEEEIAGLGFQLKERPWYSDSTPTVAHLAKNRRVASDGCRCGLALPDELARLRDVRFPLTRLERQWLRELGRTLTLALEATARNFEPGETEADLAGHLAHRLLREGVVPVDLRVASDDRLARFRQPTHKAAPIHRHATIAAVGRRHGLCASATRSVAFGKADAALRKAHALATMIEATCIYFSRPGETVAGAFRRARRIYEKFGYPDEWALDYQGFIIGYEPRERILTPESPMLFRHGMPICWSPSIASARSEDTVVVDERGFEVVTDAQRWPKLDVLVKGFSISRPGILER